MYRKMGTCHRCSLDIPIWPISNGIGGTYYSAPTRWQSRVPLMSLFCFSQMYLPAAVAAAFSFRLPIICSSLWGWAGPLKSFVQFNCDSECWVMDWEEIEEDRVAMVLAGPNLICCYTNNRETGGRGASRWLKYCGVLERQFVRNNLNGFAWLPGVNIEISREWKSISHMFSSQIFTRIRNRTVCLECVHQQ